jgi:hypothetical protein
MQVVSINKHWRAGRTRIDECRMKKKLHNSKFLVQHFAVKKHFQLKHLHCFCIKCMYSSAFEWGGGDSVISFMLHRVSEFKI